PQTGLPGGAFVPRLGTTFETGRKVTRLLVGRCCGIAPEAFRSAFVHGLTQSPDRSRELTKSDASLNRYRLDHTDGGGGPNYLRETESGRSKKCLEFGSGSHVAASASERGEHDEIHHHGVPEAKAFPRLAPCRHDPFDNQQFAARRDCLAAVSKGCQRLVVTPANEEVGKDICISTGWHRLEGVTPDELASRGQSGCVDRLTCGLLEPRDVEHDAVRLRICFQNLHHERAVATAHVHDAAELSEVVCLD